MRLLEKLMYSLFGMDLNSKTDRQEWALGIRGFSFLDEEECDKPENIETVKQKGLDNPENSARGKNKCLICF